MAGECRSLDALTTEGPLGSTYNPGFSGRLTKAPAGQPLKGWADGGRPARPQLLAILKFFESLGWRRSPSIKTTRRRILLSARPRFVTTVVFPSPDIALVIVMMRGCIPLHSARRIEATAA